MDKKIREMFDRYVFFLVSFLLGLLMGTLGLGVLYAYHCLGMR